MNILRIAWCDLRRMMKDKMFLFWNLVMPMAFVYFFAQMMRSPERVNTWIPVFNHDGQELSQLFIEQLRTDGFSVDVRKNFDDEKYVKSWSRAVIIPATFTADLLKGTRVHVAFVKGDGNAENTLSAGARVLRNVIRFTAALSEVDVVKNRWTKNTREQFIEELNKPQQLQIKDQKHPALRPPPYGFALSLPSYLVMFVMMNSVMYGGITLAIERSQRKMTRLIAAPLHPLEIFLGKLLGRMMQPMLQASLILILGHFLFGVPLGDHPGNLFFIILSYSFCCGSLGILFGVLCSTEQQISSLGILATMAMTALGGGMWPLELTPDFFQSLARFVPSYWALTGLHNVMVFGKSFASVLPSCLALTGFGAILLSVAAPIFERRKREG